MKRLIGSLVMVVLISACGSTPSAGTSPSPGTSPSAGPSAQASATPAASPTAPAGFVLTSVTGGSVATSTVSAVRVGQHEGYDRFVIEFGGGVPQYTVTPQSTPIFTRSPKDEQVTLEGASGVLITVHSVINWTSYSGPAAFHPGYPFLRQAQLVENYEGYQQWALGISGTACVRVVVYTAPNRLVVDVTAI